MKCILLLPLLASLSYQQGCDLAGLAGVSPEQVQQKVEEGIRPYFPHVQAQALPRQKTIVAVSCAQNIGESVIDQVPDYLRASPQLSQLRQLRKWGGVIGASSYKYLRLGFERWVVELDVDTGGIRTFRPSDDYVSKYGENCSVGNAASEASASISTDFVYIGVFDVQVSSGTQSRTLRVVDTLGVYSSADFALHQEAEVTAREALIRAHLREKNLDILQISLNHLEQVGIPRQVLRQRRLVGD
jgi:hypothetical protein